MWHWQRTSVYKQYVLWGKLFLISSIGHISILLLFFFLYHEPVSAINLTVARQSQRYKNTIFVAGSSVCAANRGGAKGGTKKQPLKAKSVTSSVHKKDTMPRRLAAKAPEKSGATAHNTIKKDGIKKAPTSVVKKKEAVSLCKGTRAQQIKTLGAKKKIEPVKEKKQAPATLVDQIKKADVAQSAQVVKPVKHVEQVKPVKTPELPKPVLQNVPLEVPVVSAISKECMQEVVVQNPEADQGLPIMVGGAAEGTYYDQRHEALRQELSQSWQQPLGITTQSGCTVKVSVGTYGKATSIEMVHGSGFLMFDISVQSVCHGYQWPPWVYNRSLTIAFK